MPDRVRAWMSGRHEFRALVEVDPRRAAAFGARPVRGAAYAEFTHVAYGPRTSARREAVDAVSALIQAELPGARLLAVLDTDRSRVRAPALRLAEGPRPRLLLVGASTTGEAEALVDQVSRVWELPAGRYSAPRVPDRADMPSLWFLLPGVVLALPLLGLYVAGGPDAVDKPALGRLFRVAAPLGVAMLAAVVVLAIAVWFAARRVWSRRRRTGAAAFLAVPVLSVVACAALFDVVGAAARRVPAAAAVVLLVLVVVAVPIGVSRIGRSRLWAALAWGLPLVAGGIAPFAGELAFDYYLAWFGLGRSDVQVSGWAQWVLGVLVLGVFVLGADVGLALLVVGRRVLGPSAAGAFTAALVTLLYSAYALQIVLHGVDDRARLDMSGLPRSLPGLQPVAVCVDPVAQPYSYVGRMAPRPGSAAVYFGRSDGQLAIWTPDTGGVLIDEQGVRLRTVASRSDCQ